MKKKKCVTIYMNVQTTIYMTVQTNKVYIVLRKLNVDNFVLVEFFKNDGRIDGNLYLKSLYVKLIDDKMPNIDSSSSSKERSGNSENENAL